MGVRGTRLSLAAVSVGRCARPRPDRACYGQHRQHVKCGLPGRAADGRRERRARDVIPFGLHHMAGNVWQWCRDWYDPSFYQRAEANATNPVNRTPTLVRSERGGSWIGPAELCRSSYRRGRPPSVRGRCLGFRCASVRLAAMLANANVGAPCRETAVKASRAMGRRRASTPTFRQPSGRSAIHHG